MSVVAVTASRTSPGATALATGIALAWSHQAERSLLIEADPAGGVLALRFELDAAPSLTSFGSDVRNTFEPELVWSNTQDLRGVRCMPAPVDPRLARSWIKRLTPTLISELPRLGSPTVIDLGWVDEDGLSAPLAAAADTTLIVTTPEIAEVQSLLFQVRRLEAQGANVALVTVGNTPNDPHEIAAIAGIPLAAVLPDDPKVAAALAGNKFAPNKFRRSLLWRTMCGLADALLDEAAMASRAREASAVVSPHGTDESAATAASATPQDLLAAPFMPETAPPATTSTPPAPEVAPATAASSAEDERAFWNHEGVNEQNLQVVPDSETNDPAWAPGPLEDLAPESLSTSSEVSAPADVAPAEVAPAATAEVPAIVIMPATSTPSAVADPNVAPVYNPEPIIEPAVGEPIYATEAVDSDEADVTRRIAFAPTTPPVADPVFLLFDDGTRQELNLSVPMIIGRHRDCDVVLEDSQVSRQHGRITYTTSGWQYVDLGSRNGSSVNGHPCLDTFLTLGDELTIGRARLTFHRTSTREMECA